MQPPEQRESQSLSKVNSAGEALLEQFAAWFGSLRFLHKVLVGGNHDLVMQGLGKTRVRELFARHCTFGTVHYLEHETAQAPPVGQLDPYVFDFVVK